MVSMIESKIALDEIVRHEVEAYTATADSLDFYPVLDDHHQIYAVVIVPKDSSERPAWVFVMARIVDNFIAIDEDGALDKPLHEALMVNGGVPREQIILAYKGETIPDAAS